MEQAERLKNVINYLMHKYSADTLDQLSKKIHIGRSYISEMMNGSKPITDKFLTKLKFKESINDRYVREGIEPMVFTETHQSVAENFFSFDEEHKKTSLEKSIENLTQNELRTTAIIERLVTLLEKYYGGLELSTKGTPGTETILPNEKADSL